MVIPSMRLESDDDVRLHVGNDRAEGGFDIEHVDIRECMRVVVPLAFLARRVVKPQEHRFLDAEAAARLPEFLDPQRTKVVDRADRWMRLAGFAVSGADERDAYSAFAETGEYSAVENLIVWMGQHDQ
jgi:hypothetical protein